MFLTDLRSLSELKSFAYRAGSSILINNAAIRIARRPDPLARALVTHVLSIADPRPNAVGAEAEAEMKQTGGKAGRVCRLTTASHLHVVSLCDQHICLACAARTASLIVASIPILSLSPSCAGHWLLDNSLGAKLPDSGGKAGFHFVSETAFDFFW